MQLVPSSLTAAVLLAVVCAAQPTTDANARITGTWRGAVVRDGSVQRIDVEIVSTAPDPSGWYSIPELGLHREPLRELTWQPPALSLRFLYGRFDCTYHAQVEEITGANERWGPPVRIHLGRTDLPPRWRYEEVSFDSPGARIAGTLVLPSGAGPHPAAVVIAGSHPKGRHDGDNAWTYRGWGETLAARGLAALVYDKRGTGESTGDRESTFADLAADARAGVAMLRDRADIDRRRVGILGISQGGWVGPMVAVEEPELAFLVLIAAPAVGVADQELDAIAATLTGEEARAAGIEAEDVTAAQAFQRAMFEVAYGHTPWSQFQPRAAVAREQRWANFVEIPAAESDLAWWRRHEYEPANTLRQLKCPVLALYAAEDGLVPPRKNVPLLQRYLHEADNQRLTVRVLPRVGHGFERPRQLVNNEWRWPTGFWVWPRKAPGFYRAITDWLRAQRIL